MQNISEGTLDWIVWKVNLVNTRCVWIFTNKQNWWSHFWGGQKHLMRFSAPVRAEHVNTPKNNTAYHLYILLDYPESR